MSAATSQTVLHERHDGWHRITLNRPEKLNSFNEEQHTALREALEACSADETCRAVLLTGAGRGFCAGQDRGFTALTSSARREDGAALRVLSAGGR